MRLAAFPQYIIETAYKPSPGEILISITSPDEPAASPNGGFAEIYRLQIWDIQEPLAHPRLGLLRPMRVEEASALIDFVAQRRPDCQAVTIHCGAGVSRSPAVAIALAELFGGHPTSSEFAARFPEYNRHVTAVLLYAGRRHPQFPFTS